MTSPVWGEGERVRRLSVDGARRLGSRPEGSRDVLLLGLDRRPGVLSTATLKARRLITGGFTKRKEYFEVSVERPTKSLSLRVLFPRNRPPRDAYLSEGNQAKDKPRAVSLSTRWTRSAALAADVTGA